MTFSPKINHLAIASILAIAALAAGNALAAPASTQSQSTAPSQASNTTQTASANHAAAHNSSITYCQAGKIASGKFGGTVNSVSNDHYRGTAVWEVELRNSRRGAIEVKVDKASGKILQVKQD